MENFTHCRHCQGTLDLGFPFHILASHIVMFESLLSSVQLQFILPLWDLGKGHCKGIAVITSMGRVIFIRHAYTYTHPATVLEMSPAMICLFVFLIPCLSAPSLFLSLVSMV